MSEPRFKLRLIDGFGPVGPHPAEEDFDDVVTIEWLYDGSLDVSLGEGHLHHRCYDPDDLGQTLWPLLNAALERAKKRNG